MCILKQLSFINIEVLTVVTEAVTGPDFCKHRNHISSINHYFDYILTLTQN